jgi:hypothetical protein
LTKIKFSRRGPNIAAALLSLRAGYFGHSTVIGVRIPPAALAGDESRFTSTSYGGAKNAAAGVISKLCAEAPARLSNAAIASTSSDCWILLLRNEVE